MFRRLLIPLDGSELASRILGQVRRLLEQGEQVSLLGCSTTSGSSS